MPRARFSPGFVIPSFAAAVTAGFLSATPSLHAATFTLVNLDGLNEGFNDTTGVEPIGGNWGTTLGEQRRNVFKTAFAIWGTILPSPVDVRVQASFETLFCTATTGILGGALALATAHDFVGAPVANTDYPIALANRLAGTDLTPGMDDINAQFNSSVDDPICLGNVDWYYGLDHEEGGDVDLLAVVLHELGHGLGFITWVNPSTGQYGTGRPDIFSRYLYDRTLGLSWDQMTDTQRAMSSQNTGNLVWGGPLVTGNAWRFLGPAPVVRIDSPASIEGEKPFGTADFGPPLAQPPLTAEVVQAEDGTVPTTDGCQTITNAAQVAGKIAIVERGNCTDLQKTQKAQAAGAVAVIIVNNTSGRPPHLFGSDPSITIPTVSVADDDGFLIQDELSLGSTVIATMGTDPSHLAGTDPEGRVRIYAPSPIEGGSSINHWDVTATPNLLMEPFLRSDLTGVDLTQYAFVEMGWLGAVSGVGIASVGRAPNAYAAPNPFTRATSIRFDTSDAGVVEVMVFDVRGALVKRLPSSWRHAGPQEVRWDGNDTAGRPAPAGVYYWRVSSHGIGQTGRVVRVE